MEKFIAYFLTANVLLLLQAVYFRVFLARQSRFTLNRIFILGGMVASLVLPLFRLEIVPQALPQPGNILTMPEIVIGGPESVDIGASVPPTWNLWDFGIGIYLSVALVAFSLVVWRNFQILRMIWRGSKMRREGFTLVETKEKIGPASYFGFIFWGNADALDPQSAAVALAHERCHCRQLHSLDLLFIEILKAAFWFNPAVYLLRRDLRQTHEFLADQAALQVAGMDGIKRLLLLRQLGGNNLEFVNYFHSYMKARIAMLSQKTKRNALVHCLMITPLAVLMVACSSMGHPVDAQPGHAVSAVSDSQPNPDAPAFFSLDDILLNATLPLAPAEAGSKGMVCMGEMPQVLNLDTILSLDELENVANHPQLLNRDRIMKLIGYPKEAQDKKIKGKVVAKILVDETGHVIRYQFVQESDPLLRDAVVAHIEELLFRPGMKDGKPDKWWVILPFNFGIPGC